MTIRGAAGHNDANRAILRVVANFLAILVTQLGALPIRPEVRLSRLPQATRGERLQRLLYLNAQPDGTPILNQPTQGILYGRKLTGEGTSNG